MASSKDDPSEVSLSVEDREWLSAVSRADTLADLQALTGHASEHEAYFDAKRKWRNIQDRRLPRPAGMEHVPGDTVTIDGTEFVVHGITHANTDEERSFLHRHIGGYLNEGDNVFTEQGIRRMYFQSFDDVYEMDDYQWAMHRCREEGIDSHVGGALERDFDELSDDLFSIVSQVREATFSLIDSGSEVYGERFASALGDVASDFLLSHEELATGQDFRSFQMSKDAATDPSELATLQRYYKTVFLPQPLEREWLRRHDRELELFTHARNERMADYAVAHAKAPRVHLIVGAAHLPGLVYYLDQHRMGERDTADFELFG